MRDPAMRSRVSNILFTLCFTDVDEASSRPALKKRQGSVFRGSGFKHCTGGIM